MSFSHQLQKNLSLGWTIIWLLVKFENFVEIQNFSLKIERYLALFKYPLWPNDTVMAEEGQAKINGKTFDFWDTPRTL